MRPAVSRWLVETTRNRCPPGPSTWSTLATSITSTVTDLNARVTREAFSITAPGGTIAIQDYVWGRSARAALFAVNMLRATEDGGVWTEAQHRAWLDDAGFASIEVIDLENSEGQLILAKRPLKNDANDASPLDRPAA